MLAEIFLRGGACANLDPQTENFNDWRISGTNGITHDQAAKLSFDLGYAAGALLFCE
jgi:hypothetical protein